MNYINIQLKMKKKRKYKVTEKVGRPKIYDDDDLKSIVNKEYPDEVFADAFEVTVGTIQAIRSAAAKKFKIKIKNKWKNQSYGKKIMEE